MLTLLAVSPSSRNESDHIPLSAIAMTYHQRSQRAAEPEEDEPFFVPRVVGVGNQLRVLIEKHRLRLLERNPVLPPVLRVLSVVPLETEPSHYRRV